MMPGTPEAHSAERGGRFSMEQSPGFNNPQTPTSAGNSKLYRMLLKWYTTWSKYVKITYSAGSAT